MVAMYCAQLAYTSPRLKKISDNTYQSIFGKLNGGAPFNS
jgi:hypothetical protein